MVKNHFINDLYALKKAEWTHPFDNSGDVNTGVLDHIISRNLKPDLGQVLNSQLWNLYPNDEDKRVIINLEHTGSDHFPLFVRLH